MEKAPSKRDHLTADDLASFLDRRLDQNARERVEAHLADCEECRREVAAVSGLLRKRGAEGRRWWVVGPTAAAAALALVLLWPDPTPPGPGTPVHRDDPSVLENLPIPLSPVGTVTDAETFHWSPAPRADRYRLTLFDATGNVLWKPETDSLFLALADSVLLERGELYLWQVEGRIGIDRWVESDLAQFTISPSADPRQAADPESEARRR
jgi:hypothetical protein